MSLPHGLESRPSFFRNDIYHTAQNAEPGVAQGLVAEASQPLMQTHRVRPTHVCSRRRRNLSRQFYRPPVTCICTCPTLSYRCFRASCVLPKKTLAVAREKRGQEHILRVVWLIICATDETEAVWAPRGNSGYDPWGSRCATM